VTTKVTEISGQELVDVLEGFGRLAWFKYHGLSAGKRQLYLAPTVAWRYENANPALERLIEEAVKCFRGKVDWSIGTNGKNWAISPARVEAVRSQQGLNVYADAVVQLGQEDPQFGYRANMELPFLAAHVRSYVRQRLVNDMPADR